MLCMGPRAMSDPTEHTTITSHKENLSKIASDAVDRGKTTDKLESCIDPMSIGKLLDIVTGWTPSFSVNVDESLYWETN